MTTSFKARATWTCTLWIRFKPGLKGTIDSSDEIRVRSNKTIDGRGANITLSGGALELDRVYNAIVAYLRFRDMDDDGVRVIDGCSNVWVDHCTFQGPSVDGAIDVTVGSHDVAISWCHFIDWTKTSLLAANSTDIDYSSDRVTLHHNWWQQCRSPGRSPVAIIPVVIDVVTTEAPDGGWRSAWMRK